MKDHALKSRIDSLSRYVALCASCYSYDVIQRLQCTEFVLLSDHAAENVIKCNVGVDPGGIVAACLTLDPKFASSNPAEDDGFLRVIKTHNTTSFWGEVKSSFVGPMS
jgi:hypothetical protein